MTTKNRNEVGFGILAIFLAIALVLALGATTWIYQHHKDGTPNRASNTKSNSSQQKSKTSGSGTSTQTSQWVTYTSSEEKATFKYPTDWTVTKSFVSSNSSSADQTGIASPSGSITISWVSSIAGTGNEHTSTYPLVTVVDKAPISGAPGYFVVSGITTLDGTTYHPWLAVQDANGILTSGVSGDIVTFQGKHNMNGSTGETTGILFSTSGLRSSQNTPALTQAQATAWFSGSEAQQAKQILLSFSDPN